MGLHVRPKQSEVWPVIRRPRAPLVNIPDARLAESSPAMTSATLPSGYRSPPWRTYPHVPGKPRQYIVAQPACTYLVLDTLKD